MKCCWLLQCFCHVEEVMSYLEIVCLSSLDCLSVCLQDFSHILQIYMKLQKGSSLFVGRNPLNFWGVLQNWMVGILLFDHLLQSVEVKLLKIFVRFIISFKNFVELVKCSECENVVICEKPCDLDVILCNSWVNCT